MSRHAPPSTCQQQTASLLAIPRHVLCLDAHGFLTPDRYLSVRRTKHLALFVRPVVAADGPNADHRYRNGDARVPHDRVRGKVVTRQRVDAWEEGGAAPKDVETEAVMNDVNL